MTAINWINITATTNQGTATGIGGRFCADQMASGKWAAIWQGEGSAGRVLVVDIDSEAAAKAECEAMVADGRVKKERSMADVLAELARRTR